MWPMSTPHDPNDAERIQRLEENVAFSDHTASELSAEIHELNKAVLQLVTRLAKLEGRLLELDQKVSEDPGQVPPPHSAGPDVGRDPL